MTMITSTIIPMIPGIDSPPLPPVAIFVYTLHYYLPTPPPKKRAAAHQDHDLVTDAPLFKALAMTEAALMWRLRGGGGNCSSSGTSRRLGEYGSCHFQQAHGRWGQAVRRTSEGQPLGNL
jgi:hypothetical protein